MFQLSKRNLLGALVAAAALTPSAAQAKFELNAAPDPTASRATQATSLPQVQTVSPPSQGFEWGDAGIGAAAMIALLGGGAGAVAVVGRRRRDYRTPTG